MGRKKQISCKVCSKVMRSDNMKRHIKKHADLSLEDPEKLCKSILKDIVDNISLGESKIRLRRGVISIP